MLDWYARKHSRVVRSTYAAELLSLLDAIGRGNLIATVIEEIQDGAMTAPERKRKIQDGSIPDPGQIKDRSRNHPGHAPN